MKTVGRLSLSVLAMACVATAQVAHAQGAPTNVVAPDGQMPDGGSEASPAAAPAQSKSLVLDEIVVTAQKRTESIQDVPLSVTALGGETLRQKSIENLNELALYTPNTVITVGNGAGAFIKMRGLGSGNNKGFEQAVGLIIDGVYYGRIDYMTNALIDLAQVEILRGPQGTLMGKNTIAGAVNMTTANPEYEWLVDLSYAAGELNKSTLTGAISGPIIDDVLAFRLAGQRDRRDGYVYNTVHNNKQMNVYRDGARAKLAFDGVDNLSVVASVDYSKLKQQLWGVEITKSTDQMTALYSAFEPNFNGEGGEHVSHTDQDGVALKDSLTFSLKADYELGDYTLTAVSGWSNLALTNKIDADFGPAPILTLGTDDDWTQYSQELRVTSPLGVIDYVAGLYFFGSEFTTFSDLNILENVDPLSTVGGVLLPAAVAPFFAALPSVTGPITADNSYGDFWQKSASVAAFGQLRWNVWEELAVIAGLRYSYERKEATMSREFTGTGLIFMQALGQEEFEAAGTRVERDISPKISVTYAVDEELNLYGTWAQAFKGGGFNAAASQANEFEFEEEKANTYEVGLKGRFFGGAVQFNSALFYTSFENLQVSIFDGTKFVVANAADATTKGIEMDTTAILAEGLMVNFSLGYTDATYDSFPNGPCQVNETAPCDLTGRELERAPKWNGTLGANWAVPLGRLPFEFVVGGDANYQGDQFVNTDLDPNEFQEAVFIYNARIALQDIDGRWTFQVNGKNLSNEIVLQGGADVPLMAGAHMGPFGEPRLVSAEFRVRL